MDFGSGNLEPYAVGPQNGVSTYRSDHHLLKRLRSIEEEDLLNLKLPKAHSIMLNQGSTNTSSNHPPLLSLSTNPQTKMLSFSNPTTFGYTVNTGYGAGMHAPVLGAGGPFAPSQWVELQHQALIYKYIQANVAVPANLLLSLKKSGNNPYVFSGLPSGSYSFAPNSYGWGGSFHLGFSGNNTDPEPGRCRRTDGKKWRCSRDTMPDQKYCEKHLNRGRHRSRKLVEGRGGQNVAVGPTNKDSTSAPSSTSAAAKSVSGVPNSLVKNSRQYQPYAQNPSLDVNFGRYTTNADGCDKMPSHKGLSVASPANDLKSKDSIFSIPKQHNITTTKEYSYSDFGFVSSDSLINPFKSSFLNSTSYNNPILQFNDDEPRDDQYPLKHFIDQPNRATWSEDVKPDWTKLSMSIPMSSDFSSTTSPCSPREKVTLSSLHSQKETNWIPISWGSSMGGPLGEVLLNNTTNSSNVIPSNAMWSGNPQLGSSPTGVLSKTNFVSLSNSSSGSSPRAETKNIDGSSLSTSLFLPSL